MGALTDPNDEPDFVTPLCLSCIHWIRGQKCRAFANDIPVEITTMEFDHRHPHPLDNGLRYEKKEKPKK